MDYKIEERTTFWLNEKQAYILQRKDDSEIWHKPETAKELREALQAYAGQVIAQKVNAIPVDEHKFKEENAQFPAEFEITFEKQNAGS